MTRTGDALVLTLDPAMGGGVRTMQRAVCAAMERMGLRPHLGYARSGRRERFDWTVRETVNDGRPALETGYLPTIEFTNYLVPALRFREALARFDVVQVVSGVHSIALVPILARKRFVSWVATPFLDEIESRAKAESPTTSVRWNHRLRGLNDRLERSTLARASGLFTLSEYTKRRLVERTGIPADRFEVLRYPVDLRRFSPIGDRFDAVQDRFVLAVGRVDDERKNVGALIRAFARVAARHPRVRLVLAGEIEPESAVRKLAQRLGIVSRVVFTGPLEPEALAAAYRSADLFVMTSRQEGLGIAILEAQASGTPPLIMPSGGGDELITQGETGWVSPPDEDAFAFELDRLLADDRTRLRVGATARERLENTQSFERFTSRLAESYATVWPELGWPPADAARVQPTTHPLPRF